MNAVEQMRQAVAELATEVVRLHVNDHLDDPHDPWIQITQGPYKTGDTDRYVRLTIEVEPHEPDGDEVGQLKAKLRQRLAP